jgi:S1-C subfamily serine protease
MDEILLLDAAERYLRGEMSEAEKIYFEDLRKNNPEIDQVMVENSFFLNEVDNYSNTKNFKHNLYETEARLSEEGVIKKPLVKGKAKLVYLWKKHKRTVAVAASIAGMVSIFSAGLTAVYNNKRNPELDKLSRELIQIKGDQKETSNKLKEVESKIDPKATPKSGGTGFLIDGQGYLITNAHVLKGKTTIATNEKGEQFLATICMQDNTRDIAVLKINDKDFIPYKSLPYSISKSVNLAEPIFTMGYPKDQIVYSEGYLSSETGYKSDTLTYQISIAADHGNSGGPVLNKNGDIIGILTDKSDGGAVFAVKSIYIFNAVENLKKDTAYSDIKLAGGNSIKKMIREDQVKKVNSCVFLIKSYE